MEVTYSDLMKTLIRIDNKPLDLDDFFYQKDIFNLDLDSSPSIVLKTSRQVGKSTAIIGKMAGESKLKEFFKSLYVSPTREQTQRFSNLFKSVIKQSPLLNEDIGDIDKVTHRTFNNGSEIYFSYANHDAERIRGLANIGMVAIDEIQSIENQDVIPVILEVSAESKYGYTMYCGTPLSVNNVLEQYWQNSVQHEWVVKCDGCGTWAVPYDGETMLKMIGKNGPICTHCGKELYPPGGMWAVVNNSDKSTFRQGFHATRIFRYPKDETKRKKQWREVLMKLEEYPESRFLNEVLGVSVDVGGAILSLTDIQRATLNLPMASKKESMYGIPQVIMGIDWGVAGSTLGSDSKSFTVVAIGGYDIEGKFKIIYGKRYEDANILEHIEDIVRLAVQFNVELIAADYGVGKTNNAILKDKLGYNKVAEMQYVSQNVLFKHNPSSGLFTIDKTSAIGLVVHAIKTGTMFFTQGLTSLLQDLLAVYEEETHTGKKIYRRQTGKSDDFLHAITFAFTAANKILRRTML